MQLPLVNGALHTPGEPPDVSHQSPAWHGQAPLTPPGTTQVQVAAVLQTSPGAQISLVQLPFSPAVRNGGTAAAPTARQTSARRGSRARTLDVSRRSRQSLSQ